MPFDWGTAEDAIYDWVILSTGLDNDKVQWSRYAQPRQEGQFVILTMRGPTQIGLDYVQSSTNLANPAGEEIELTVVGNRNVVVTIECFGGDPTTDTATALASKIMTGVRLPSINTLLKAGGISPHGTPSILFVPAILGAKFESRAVLEHEFYFVDNISENAGYINTVSGTGTIDEFGSDIEIPFLVEDI
jgi:hypothetical protein